jgi:hypothetical protein
MTSPKEYLIDWLDQDLAGVSAAQRQAIPFQLVFDWVSKGRYSFNPDYLTFDKAHLQVPAPDRPIASDLDDSCRLTGS